MMQGKHEFGQQKHCEENASVLLTLRSRYSNLPSTLQGATTATTTTAGISVSADWCNGLKYRHGPGGVKTALASFPGSGNTWVRYLLQQVSGIYTGSIYTDGVLKKKGFAENKQDNSVLVVKTHNSGPNTR